MLRPKYSVLPKDEMPQQRSGFKIEASTADAIEYREKETGGGGGCYLHRETGPASLQGIPGRASPLQP